MADEVGDRLTIRGRNRGGGPAGLAAALILGRMRRRVLLLDADDPAHGVSEGVHGLFAHDGTPPLELRQTARDQLRPYESVTVRMVAADEARPTPDGFAIVGNGTASEAGVLLLATGARYELPPIDGRLARIVFADGSTDDRAGLFFVPSFTWSALPAQLGCDVDESGAIVIDEDGRTSVPGVFAAGDGTTDKKSVVLAAAAGSRAAYAINAGLAERQLPVIDLSKAPA